MNDKINGKSVNLDVVIIEAVVRGVLEEGGRVLGFILEVHVSTHHDADASKGADDTSRDSSTIGG